MKNKILIQGFDHLLPAVKQSTKYTGLFGYSAMSHPEGLAKAAENSIMKATKLVEMVCEAESEQDIKRTVKRVDTISDILCSVLDPAEFIRNVHPDESFVNVANQVCSALHTFLSQLNTHKGLYLALKKVEDISKISLSPHEKKVASLLLQDFEKSGVHMSLVDREKFIHLNDQIQSLGQDFATNSYPSRQSVAFNLADTKFDGVPSKLLDALIQKQQTSKKLIIPTHSDVASILMRTCKNPKVVLILTQVRQEIFLALNSASKHQIDTLEEMLKKRAELAQLLNQKSYSHMHLADKMASTPENVDSFLKSIAKTIKPFADKEFEKMANLKLQDTGKSCFLPWDKPYYSHQISSMETVPQQSHSDAISSYFSVGNTFSGLSSLFYSMYGITLEMQETIPGEVWHPDIRKLSVIHETEGLIGTIYCDLFQRDSLDNRKYDNAAHFTVRCSRRIDDDENLDSGQYDLVNPDYEKVINGKRYQLPIVVLVTNFTRPTSNQPALLDLSEIETLFHEMGHAMHSMLAQTDFQHISGTRVAMDFVEVPSILMEYFAKSPSVLESFGRHHKTNQAVPISLIEQRLSKQGFLQSLEIQNQIQMALLDQLYHSKVALEENFDTTQLMYELFNETSSIKPSPKSQWQIQFSHLFTYGASYYSYLWSRRWASRIHRKLFEGKKSSEWRQGGEILRTHLLGVGGSQDPWIGLRKIGVAENEGSERINQSKLEDLE